MNEINFRDIEPIEGRKTRFKCFESPDGYQATFYVCDKNDETVQYKISFKISGTKYNSDPNNSGKSTKEHIDEKYGNLEKCFEYVGRNYLGKKILANELKNEELYLLDNFSL
ncbi:MAG: hypothetical protein WC878_05985 [Candidatus Paceibacterota bacterium]|jgi:hypothetical protein